MIYFTRILLQDLGMTLRQYWQSMLQAFVDIDNLMRFQKQLNRWQWKIDLSMTIL